MPHITACSCLNTFTMSNAACVVVSHWTVLHAYRFQRCLERQSTNHVGPRLELNPTFRSWLWQGKGRSELPACRWDQQGRQVQGQKFRPASNIIHVGRLNAWPTVVSDRSKHLHQSEGPLRSKLGSDSAVHSLPDTEQQRCTFEDERKRAYPARSGRRTDRNFRERLTPAHLRVRRPIICPIFNPAM